MKNKTVKFDPRSPTGLVYTEEETRRRLLNVAKFWGIEHDVKVILEKFDKALIKATTELERKHIAEVGASEIHKLLGMYGSLEVGGKTIIKEKK